MRRRRIKRTLYYLLSICFVYNLSISTAMAWTSSERMDILDSISHVMSGNPLHLDGRISSEANPSLKFSKTATADTIHEISLFTLNVNFNKSWLRFLKQYKPRLLSPEISDKRFINLLNSFIKKFKVSHLHFSQDFTHDYTQGFTRGVTPTMHGPQHSEAALSSFLAPSVAKNKVRLEIKTMNGTQIGILTIPSFESSHYSQDEVEAFFDELKNKAINKLLVDFRGNTGGLSNAAEHLSTLLSGDSFGILPVSKSDLKSLKNGNELDKNNPSTLREAYQELISPHAIKHEREFGHLKGKSKSFETLAVLIDKDSASCSEYVSANLKELGKGWIIGQKSSGDLLTSYDISLPHKARLQIPNSDFITKSGYYYEGKGITPDIPIDTKNKSNENVLDEALEYVASNDHLATAFHYRNSVRTQSLIKTSPAITKTNPLQNSNVLHRFAASVDKRKSIPSIPLSTTEEKSPALNTLQALLSVPRCIDNLNAQTLTGATPLHLAVIKGNLDIVAALLEEEAKLVKSKGGDQRGNDPFYEPASLLRDNLGARPIDQAKVRWGKDSEMFKLLEDHLNLLSPKRQTFLGSVKAIVSRYLPCWPCW